MRESDWSSDVCSSDLGSHQEDEVRQGYTAHGWPILEPSIGNVGAGIDRVRGLFELNKVFIFDNCVKLLSEIATYRWKISPQGEITNEIEDKATYHLLDCCRYILSSFKPETAEVNKAPKVTGGSW
jgi:hypothetical protein